MLFRNTALTVAGLLGLSQASPVAHSERQEICPAGSSQVLLCPQVVHYPVLINQYFENNTIINIGNITVNIDNAPTSLSTTITVTSTTTVTSALGAGGVVAAAATATPGSVVIPGVTEIAGVFVLQIQAAAAAARKRQNRGGFLAAGSAAKGDCGSASQFTLNNGQLFSADGLVSVNAGVSLQVFGSSNTVGAITTTFSSFNGELRWTNESFYNNEAVFCFNQGVLSVLFEENIGQCTSTVITTVPLAECNLFAVPSSSAPSTASPASESANALASELSDLSDLSGDLSGDLSSILFGLAGATSSILSGEPSSVVSSASSLSLSTAALPTVASLPNLLSLLGITGLPTATGSAASITPLSSLGLVSLLGISSSSTASIPSSVSSASLTIGNVASVISASATSASATITNDLALVGNLLSAGVTGLLDDLPLSNISSLLNVTQSSVLAPILTALENVVNNGLYFGPLVNCTLSPYQANAEIFTACLLTTLGQAANATVADTLSSLQNVVTAANSAVNAANSGLGLSSTLGHILATNPTPALTSAVSGLTGLLTGTVIPIVTSAIGLVPSAVSVVEGLIPSLVSEVNGLIPSATSLVPSVVSAIEALLPSLVSGLFPSAATGLIPSVISELDGLLPSLVSGVNDLLPTVTGLVPSLISDVSGLLPTVTGLVPSLISDVSGLLPPVTGLGPSLLSEVSALLPTATGLLPSLSSALNGLLPTATGLVPSLLSDVSALLPTATGLLPSLSSALNNLLPTSALTNLLPTLPVTNLLPTLPLTNLLPTASGLIPTAVTGLTGTRVSTCAYATATAGDAALLDSLFATTAGADTLVYSLTGVDLSAAPVSGSLLPYFSAIVQLNICGSTDINLASVTPCVTGTNAANGQAFASCLLSGVTGGSQTPSGISTLLSAVTAAIPAAALLNNALSTSSTFRQLAAGSGTLSGLINSVLGVL